MYNDRKLVNNLKKKCLGGMTSAKQEDLYTTEGVYGRHCADSQISRISTSYGRVYPFRGYLKQHKSNIKLKFSLLLLFFGFL